MKDLEIDQLLGFVKGEFDGFQGKRAGNQHYRLGDVLQSGLAIFSLKDSSLLEFNQRFAQRAENLKRVYKIGECPSDSQVRKIIDKVPPIQVERVQRSVIQKVKENGLFGEYEYFKGWKLLLVDGVQHFSSNQVKCGHCQKRKHEDGTITYSHSMLASVIAHPDKKEVLPLCGEPILNQDGDTKNDCELNAAKRLTAKVQTRHLSEKFVFVEDALFANGPHIKAIQDKGNRFIIRVKPGSGAASVLQQYGVLKNRRPADISTDTPYEGHKLFKRHGIKKPAPASPELKEATSADGQIIKVWNYVNSLYLNESYRDVKVNFVRYEERAAESGEVLKAFEWITDIPLTAYNVKKVSKAGRCRWMIENETFNTLKNQGYHFEHNFGHGHEHLCTNFALLMMLAFLIDQVQQLCNKVFNGALLAAKRKKYLWEDMRSFFRTLPFGSMEMIYKAIIHGIRVEFLVVKEDP